LNTLITAANSAMAYQLKNKLDTDATILGDYLDLPAFMVKPGKLICLPDPKSASYTHEMLALCLDERVSVVYALREAELQQLLKATQLFEEYGISIINNNEV
jgi:hypothetical protein